MPISMGSVRWLLVPIFLAMLWSGPCRAAAADGTWRGLGDPQFIPIGQTPDRPTILWPGVLAQDSRGFIWGGGEQGLERWDGYRLRLYAPGRVPDDGLRNHYILALHVDAAGTLWAGTNTGELARYDPQADRFTDVALGPAAAATPAIWAIQDDGAGGLWVGTEAGLYRLDATGRTVAPVGPDPAGGLPDAETKALLRDRSGALWAGGRGGLARRAPDGGPFKPLKLPTAPGQAAEVTRLMQDSAGRVWIGTRQSGAFVMNPGETIAHAIPIPGQDQHAAAPEITAIAEATPGRVWLGTYGSGIVEAAPDGTVVRRIRHDPLVPGGLNKNTIYALFRDRSGLVWVGTTGGLSLYRAPQGFASLTGDAERRTGLPMEDITAALSKSDGTIWLGSEREGVAVIDRQGRIVHRIDVQRVQCMADTPDGGALVGTRAGLFRLDPAATRLTHMTIPGRAATAATSSCRTEADIAWIGDSDDGLWQLRLGAGTAHTLIRHLTVPRLTNTQVEAIGAAPDGRLALGMADGFMLLDRATGALEAVRSIQGDPQSVSPGQVASFGTDRAGRLWVGTNSAGLSVQIGRDAHHRPRFRRVGVADGLPNADVNAMLMDGQGRIWASTDDGLAEIDPVTLAVHAFGAVDGVAIGTYWNSSGVITQEGALLFGGVGGATVVWPDAAGAARDRAPVVVTEVRVGQHTGDALARGQSIEVPPSANSFAIEFSALDYTDPDSNRYRYRLLGFDSDWVAADAAHRVAAYTNLSPGLYSLELDGTDRHGVWRGRPAIIAVRVLPAWYQSLWCRSLEGAAVLLALTGIVQVRTLVMRRRQRELERQVSDRTAELTAKQNELHEIAYIDSLTGLANRRSFTETITRMLHNKTPQPFALLLIDLDGFKAVNDMLGHDAGDAVLLAAADRLRESVRDSDFVARLGGDEFAILLLGADLTVSVDMIADRVTKNIAAIQASAGTPIKIGASVGAALSPRDGVTQEDLYKRADKALYAVKRSGRGAWRIYETEMEIT